MLLLACWWCGVCPLNMGTFAGMHTHIKKKKKAKGKFQHDWTGRRNTPKGDLLPTPFYRHLRGMDSMALLA